MLAVRRFPLAYSLVSVGYVVVAFHGVQHPQQLVLERRTGLVVTEGNPVPFINGRGPGECRRDDGVIYQCGRACQAEGGRVGNESCGVAGIGRPHNRQDNVRAVTHPVVAEGPAEILGLALESPDVSRVPEAGDAYGGVYDEAAQGDAGGLELELKEVVGEVAEFVDIADGVGDPVFNIVRQDEFIGAYDRDKEMFVKIVVEAVGAAVEPFDRIADFKQVGAVPLDYVFIGAQGGTVSRPVSGRVQHPHIRNIAERAVVTSVIRAVVDSIVSSPSRSESRS